jgi:Ni/Co efflux regulator RcnB
MKRLLAVVAAIALIIPVMAMAQTPPKGKGPPPKGKPAPHVVAPHKPPHVAVRPGPGRGPARGPVRVARPAPPRGNQFFHRGRSFSRIHGPAFVYPRGWGYRRWAIGAIFPALFLTSAYYYNDYAALGLQPPPPGYMWERYGPDLLLVNLTTGVVEDVVYGVFM